MLIFSGMITVCTVVVPAVAGRGSEPTIVIGYVTPLDGSLYWNVKCGIVRAFARNCGSTPPIVSDRGALSLELAVAAGFEPAVAAAATRVAANATTAHASRPLTNR